MALQGIADQLLQEGLLLTALELHAELTERGKGLSSLREFFDNSTNFEKFTRKFDSAASPCLSTSSFDGVANLRARAPSQATLDSISLFEATRFSEDSHAQNEDRMAVLEFELRKARDTIHSLRSELTSQAAKSSAGSKDIHGDKAKGTLSHETSEEDDEDQPEIQAVEQRTLNYLVNEYLLQHNYKLTSITFSDENSEEDFEDWDSIGLNVSKPPNLLRLYRDYKQHVTPERDVKEFGCQTNDRDKVVKLHETISALEKNVSDLQEENVLISEEVQKKEYELKDDQVMIESLQKNQEELEKQIETFKCSKSALQDPDAPLIASNRKMGQEITPPPPPCLSASQSYVKFIESRCLCDTEPKSSSSSITEESQDEVVNLDSVLTILAESVPKIVPNVILAKRDELIPLLMITIQIHPDSRIRDQFLNILFNLIKRPDLEQRKMILSGFLLMAAKFGATRIEAELLPQCWEQINHKYDERRILVAETCGTLMPYIPSSLRCSLLLSMLTQLALEDREPEVRCAAIRSLAVLVLYLEDEIKFESLWNLVIALLKDPEGDIVLITQDTLLLSMAHFSMNLGTLETVICEDRLLDFDKHCDLAEEEKSALESRMLTLKKLLPFVIYSVMTSAPQIKENVVEETSEEDILDDRCSIDLEILLGSSRKYLNLLRQVQEILGKEWYESWSQLEWISNNLLAKLASCSFRIPMLDMDHDRLTDDFISLVQDLVLAFGPKFAKDKLSPHFERFINLSFEDSNSKEEGAVLSDQILLPIYSLGLLRHVCTPLEIAETLKKWILFHVISGHNTSSLTFILDHLGRSSIHQDPLAETAWQLVVHQTPKVRCFASKYLNVMSRCCLEGHDDILGNKILPGK